MLFGLSCSDPQSAVRFSACVSDTCLFGRVLTRVVWASASHFSQLFSIRVTKLFLFLFTTFSDESLGSDNDEGRSKVR